MTQRALGAYAARRCAVRTQWDALRPAEPLPMSDLGDRLARERAAFTATVAARLTAAGGDAVVACGDDVERGERIAVTLAAMAAGARVVVGGRLPTDEVGRREAWPDVLVRAGDAPVDGRWRYRPAMVARHSMLVEQGGLPVVVDEVEALADGSGGAPADDRTEPRGQRGQKVRRDLMRLAHEHRALAATGHGADGDAWAAVVSKEELAVWYRLDVPMWQGADHSSHEDDRVTSLERYDVAFARRLAALDAALAHAEDPSVPLAEQPVRISECDVCPWHDHCQRLLVEAQHPSLLPRLGPRQSRLLTDAGVDTIHSLAALPRDAAVDDLDRGELRKLVDEARARIGAAPLYLREGRAPYRPVRADVEVDVDMENGDQVYLWGALVTDRAGTALAPPGYRPFADWRPGLTEEDATELFLTFWRWLTGLRDACAAAGHSFAAYCWSGPVAEDKWLRAYGARAGLTEEVEALIASDVWVDLEHPFRHTLVTGHRTGLKVVARLAGFRWRDEDAGGGQSTVWYERATDVAASAAERDAMVRRLLTYNEDDVLATLAVREWVDAAGDLSHPPVPGAPA